MARSIHSRVGFPKSGSVALTKTCLEPPFPSLSHEALARALKVSNPICKRLDFSLSLFSLLLFSFNPQQHTTIYQYDRQIGHRRTLRHSNNTVPSGRCGKKRLGGIRKELRTGPRTYQQIPKSLRYKAHIRSINDNRDDGGTRAGRYSSPLRKKKKKHDWVELMTEWRADKLG